jgi:DNA-binding GntR family transcriptional regulator
LLNLFWQVFRRLNEANFDMDDWPFQTSAREHLRIVEMLEARDKAALLEAHRQHFHAVFDRLEVAKTVLASAATGAGRTDLEPLTGLNLAGRLDRLKP